MSYVQAMLRVEMRALLALFTVSMVAAVGYAFALMFGSSAYPPLSIGLLTLQFTFIIGLVPVAAVGAPIYTWMQLKRRATWPLVVALGALPGAVALPFAWSFGATALACGVAVSCLTHILARRDLQGEF